MKAKNKKIFTFGQRLRFLREKVGLTQTKFAEKLGFRTYHVVGRLERDERLPNVETLLKLHEICDVNLHWLITGTQSPDSEAWKNSYIELAWIAKHYIAWDNEQKHNERGDHIRELQQLREKESRGIGVWPERIKYLENRIAELDKQLLDNAATEHKIWERIYSKSE